MTHFLADKFALEVDGLRYEAPNGSVLLDSVTLSLEAGEILAVVGLNGAGKSTLIRLIAGLLAPSSGTISLSGTSYTELSTAERARQIAYFGQHDDADGRLLLRDYVELGTLPYRASLSAGEINDRVINALHSVNMVDKEASRLSQLSGGERQRAKFARAVCQMPKLLLLDEPTNHLDPAAKGAMLTAAMQLGITVVTALHDLTLIDSFASHVAVLKQGELTAFGHPTDILNADTVHETFGVQLFRFQHPQEPRILPSLDVEIGRERRFTTHH